MGTQPLGSRVLGRRYILRPVYVGRAENDQRHFSSAAVASLARRPRPPEHAHAPLR